MARYVETTTPLNSGVTFTSPNREGGMSQSIVGTVKADQGGTLHVEQSYDGTNFDFDTSATITANTGAAINVTIVAPWWRIRYVNGGTNQGSFRLYARAIQPNTN